MKKNIIRPFSILSLLLFLLFPLEALTTSIIDITVNPAFISAGEEVDLSWNGTDIENASIDNGIGEVAVPGNQSVSPTIDTTYIITAEDEKGEEISDSVFVEILPPPPPSPEEQCFSLLSQEAQNRWGIDLSAVQKEVSGGKNSAKFDVSDYDSFLEISQKKIPTRDRDMKNFPDDLDRVASHRLRENPLYKQNRLNLAPAMYLDGSNTFAGNAIFNEFSRGRLREHSVPVNINGHFIDAQVVTFGKRYPNFYFPWPSAKTREELEDEGKAYPEFIYGIPYVDYREYLVLTHHLNKRVESNPNKRFLSCELVKIEKPANETYDDFTVNSYGGNSLSGSSINSNTIANGSFLKTYTEIQALKKDGWMEGVPYQRMKTIAFSYDNDSSFFNQAEALPLYEDAMFQVVNSVELEEGIADSAKYYLLIRDYYKRLKGKGFGITGRLDAGKSLSFLRRPSSFFSASTLLSDKNSSGSLVYYGSVPIEVLDAIDALDHYQLSQYLHRALTPGYSRIQKQYADLIRESDPEASVFWEKMSECPLKSQKKRAENVFYILDQLDGVEKADPFDLEYLDRDFGHCVIPYMDRREQKILLEAEKRFISQQKSDSEIQAILKDESLGSIEERIEKINNTPDDSEHIKAQKKDFVDTHLVLLDLKNVATRENWSEDRWQQESRRLLTSSFPAIAVDDVDSILGDFSSMTDFADAKNKNDLVVVRKDALNSESSRSKYISWFMIFGFILLALLLFALSSYFKKK